MKNQIIEVKVEESDENAVAKIIEETDTTFLVKFLNETKKTYEGAKIYKFSNSVSEIEKECVDHFFNSKNVEDAGFEKIDGVGYILQDEGECYDPPESDTDTDSDVSSLDDDEEELEL